MQLYIKYLVKQIFVLLSNLSQQIFNYKRYNHLFGHGNISLLRVIDYIFEFNRMLRFKTEVWFNRKLTFQFHLY